MASPNATDLQQGINQKDEKCEWTDCPTHSPNSLILYSSSAMLGRGTTDWASIKPSGQGRTLTAAQAAENNSKYGGKVRGMIQNTNSGYCQAVAGWVAQAAANNSYYMQKHHLICCYLFSYGSQHRAKGMPEAKIPKVIDNLRLTSYDINHKTNGIFLPYFQADMYRHGLQSHRGSHPYIYYKTVVDLLEKKVKNGSPNHKTFCKGKTTKGTQEEDLVKQMNGVSEIIRKRIEKWNPTTPIQLSFAEDKIFLTSIGVV